MRTRLFLLRGILFASVWLCGGVPAVAQGVGAIGGTALDPSGAVLPGVTVTLSSAQGGTVGGSQERVTDERGAYQFLRLVPGTYIVRGQLAGFRPVEQRNVVVTADATARADLALAIGQVEEGVIVTGEAPLLDTTSALRQTVLSQEVLQTLPNRIDVWSIARAIPNLIVNRTDVGGTASFRQATVTVHGTSNEGGYVIDGMNVSSTSGFGITSTFYIIPWAFAEANYQAGNAPAESSRGGLLYNMITRTGTNQLRGGVATNYTGSPLVSKNVSPELSAQVLRSIPASVRAANPNLQPSSDVRYFYDYGGWLGGPIKRDKLWFSSSWFYQQILQHALGSYSPDGSPVPDDSYIWNNANKVAWQVDSSSQLSYFNTIQRKVEKHVADPGVFQEIGATTHNGKTPHVHQVKWTSSLSSKMVFDASASSMTVNDVYNPPPEAAPGAIAAFDQLLNTQMGVAPTHRNTYYRRRGFRSNINFFTVAHDVKAGYQFEHAQTDNTVISHSNSMRAVFRSGVPDAVNTYTTPSFVDQKDLEHALYVQDRWQPTRKLTVNLGLRFETNYGWVDAVCQEATAFVVARCFDAQKGFPDFKDVNPRLSAIYDLAGDGRTALKFSANRYVVPIGVSVVNRVSPSGVVSDSRRWTACGVGQTSACDLNGDLRPQLNELGPSSGYPTGSTTRYADGYSRPFAREYSIELQREFAGNIVASAGYTRRQRLEELGQRNVAVPASAYIPLTVTEVNSGRPVTVYNRDPSLRGLTETVWDNESELDSVYDGATFSVNKRMSDGWMVSSGLSLGKTMGYVGIADQNNPNSKEFSRGVLGNDVPVSFRLTGLYELPFRVSLSGTYQYQTGFPEQNTVSVGNNTVALTQGTQSVFIEPRGATRLPATNQLDISLRKAFRSGSRVFQPRLDVYNLGNVATITSRVTVAGPNFGVVDEVTRGRLIKLGMSVDF
jgi:Carboxypeptidase regulatory-like domain